MSMNTDSISLIRGSFAYENWKAVLAGEPLKSVLEYPLFTDARILGELVGNYNPYQLLNTVPMHDTGQILPSIILRIEYHAKYYSYGMLQKTDTERYHGGLIHDEIAALVSLCLGIRLKAGGMTRHFEPEGDPKGHPAAHDIHENPTLMIPFRRSLILQSVLGEHNLVDASILSSLPNLNESESIALVRAARLYQDAVWIVESAPELSWIMLVSAVETAAGHWRPAKEPPVERMRVSKPDLEPLLLEAGGEELVSKVADMIADYMGAGRKFIDFIFEYLPEPPLERPPGDYYRVSWEPQSLKKSLRTIYGWRSNALHNGTPFPLPMCEPPGRHTHALAEKPGGAIGAKGAVWVDKDIPMYLHTFEYIVRNVLVSWWKDMVSSKTAT